MRIVLQRIYDDRQQSGYRVLVDRIWPRGITKEKAALDEWCKALAPSTELRKWFGHDPQRWEEFSRRYTKELSYVRDEGKSLLQRAKKRSLVLLYGAKDSEHTHALVLKDYLDRIQAARI